MGLFSGVMHKRQPRNGQNDRTRAKNIQLTSLFNQLTQGPDPLPKQCLRYLNTQSTDGSFKNSERHHTVSESLSTPSHFGTHQINGRSLRIHATDDVGAARYFGRPIEYLTAIICHGFGG